MHSSSGTGEIRFKPITIKDKAVIQPFLDARQVEESHLAFSNLLMWQGCYHTGYTILDDVLYLTLHFGKYRNMFFEPLPMEEQFDIKRIMDTLLSFYGDRKQDLMLRSVSTRFKESIEQMYGDAYYYREDRKNYDYIYNTKDLMELKGSKYHAKRNHINKFITQNAFEYKPYGEEYKEGCWALYQRWYEQREGTENPEDDEAVAMRLALDEAEALGFKGGVVLIDGQVEAFTLGERLTKNMAVIHVEKANSEIQGLYPLINQLFVQREWSDTEFINREEDMGVPGLRKAKLSYRPVRFLEKFIITPKLETCTTL